MLPATMMPEILLRGAANPALQGGRVVGDDAVDVRFAIPGGANGHTLVVHDVLPAGLTQGGSEHDRRTEAKGEHRGPARF